MKRALAIALAVILAGYTYGAYFFSSELVAFKVKSSEFILNENNLKGPATVGLSAPELVHFT
ncbi:MAG: hypothetical protein HY042_00670, partial [Spirochaetia bacterium]|nr:hypothetical protein [Spirochaetia bacterium]